MMAKSLFCWRNSMGAVLPQPPPGKGVAKNTLIVKVPLVG